MQAVADAKRICLDWKGLNVLLFKDPPVLLYYTNKALVVTNELTWLKAGSKEETKHKIGVFCRLAVFF